MERAMVDFPVDASMKRALFYIVTGDDGGRFVREAKHSLSSVFVNLPTIDTVLFLSGPTDEDVSGFDDVRRLPDRSSDFWYLDSTRFFVQAVEELSGYDQLLYLDSDTYIARPSWNLFDVLDQYEYAIAQSPQRDCCKSRLNPAPPESFCTLENGVTLFRNTKKVRRFLREEWLARYEGDPLAYDDNDCAPLRDALWLNKLGLKWVTLAPEWALRFDFGAWVMGRVRILHGRIGGISTDVMPLADAAEWINAYTGMRIWNHGALLSTGSEQCRG
jgi:hypothetical protein